ncbi:Vitamin B12 transporter BtuB [Alphaproteobacteria bacterium SO-S41]|nr:Vitamin B12 transporter BtuB [Alphaproteobacteria bacterium SO-S41]
MRSKTILDSILLSGVAALALGLGATAFAQGTTAPATATDEDAAEAAAKAAAAEGDEEIVVVGSRVRRTTYNSASPVQVITREESTLAGYSTTTEALQGTAVTGGSAQINNAFGGFVTNGGPGANTVGLRGLGAGRTLVLINGRRVAPAGTRGAVGSADLNVLPGAIIDRIEVLRDGASSIYGSDAIAGVINVITKKNIEGLTIEGQYNKTHEGHGDESRVAVVGGMTGDDWTLSGSAEYYEREGLTLADRDWAKCNIDNRINRTTGALTDTIDPITGKPKCYPITTTGSNGVTINTIGTSNTIGVAAPGATGTTFNRWRPNSAVTTGLIGFEGVGGGTTTNTNIRDTFDPKTLNRSLISGARVMTAFLQGSYELHSMGNAEIYAEVLLNRRESEQTGFRQLSLDYNKGSPLIPAGLQASTFSGPSLTSGPRNVGVRAFIGFGNDQSSQEVDYYKATAGIRGELGFSDWRYDVNVSYSKSDATYTFQSWLTSRLAATLNAVAAPVGFTGPVRNGLTCAINLIDPTANCIVAPALNNQTIGGILPEDWKNYTFVPVTGRTKYDELVFSAQADGTLFEIWGGNKVSAVFGIEYRTAEIDDTPSIYSQNGDLYNFTSSAITRGDDSVLEVYGEVEVPLLKDQDFAKELTLNVSGRYTDYDSYGSDWTYKVTGIYSPVDWLSFRSTYGTSYRAPALFEQFQGATSGFLSNTIDPCNGYGGDPGTFRFANCASEGLPGNFTNTQSVAVISAGGAAQGLKAETSDNLTAGVVFNFDLGDEFGKLNVAVDYYDIQIDNGVQRAGAANILQLCYDDPQFRAGGGYCRYVAPRNPVNGALTVQDSYTNVATVIVRGMDYNVRWEAEVGPGTLLLNASLTQYFEQSSKLASDDEFDDANGSLNNPEFTGTFDATYTYDSWKFRYGLEWIEGMDSFEYLGVDEATTGFQFRVPNYYLHHISVQYMDEEAQWGATVGVRNLFDEIPPQTVSSGFYNLVGNAPLYSGYDYAGREFFVNITKGF